MYMNSAEQKRLGRTSQKSVLSDTVSHHHTQCHIIAVLCLLCVTLQSYSVELTMYYYVNVYYANVYCILLCKCFLCKCLL